MSSSMIYHDVYHKLQHQRQLLFSRESQSLYTLNQSITNTPKDLILVWAFYHVSLLIDKIEKKHPHEHRPRLAYEKAKQWLKKEIKFPNVKQAILACHAAAHDYLSSADQALFHAIGQGLSTIHVKTHAIGLPIYELTSIVRDHQSDFEHLVSRKIEEYTRTLESILSSNPL